MAKHYRKKNIYLKEVSYSSNLLFIQRMQSEFYQMYLFYTKTIIFLIIIPIL